MTLWVLAQSGAEWIPIAGFLVAVLGLWIAWLAHRRGERKKSAHEFRMARALLESERVRLTRRAITFYERESSLKGAPGAQKLAPVSPGIPLLVGAGWIPNEPLPLEAVQLLSASEREGYEGTLRRARYMLPYDETDVQFATYADAVQAELATKAAASGETPPLFVNRRSYRLIDVRATPEFRLSIASGKYFDHQNTDEVVGYEMARAEWRRRHRRLRAPFERNHRLRSALGNPLDLSARCVIPGISTLTIRKAGSDSRFFMHERTRVALAQGTQHVTPAGEFQPSGPAPDLFDEDRDLWRNIQREYDEEFLGTPETWDTGKSPDYENDEPYKTFDAAYRSKQLRVWFLGIGLDPLTLKAEILTCAVWAKDAFDHAFGKMVERNEEGMLILHKDRKGIPLEAKRLESYRESQTILSAGRACIDLFGKHWDFLMGST
jgi:hypothetical protein